jgi:F-type H+-transporting ATPase subunit epsilon
VLAEEAMALGEIDRGQVESQIRDLGEDMKSAQADTERRAVQARLLVAEAKLAALEETSGG